MAVDRVWFENFFQRQDKNLQVVKILDMTEELATKKGDNFMSQVTRVTLKVEQRSGLSTDEKFIVKRIPEELIDFVKDEGFFENEIVAYKLLSQMEQLMKSKGDTRDPFWCHMVGYTDRAIVFEDLAVGGFQTINLTDLFNKEESICALTKLARFHALGLVLMKQDVPEIKQLMTCFAVEKRQQKMLIYQPLRCLRDAVKIKWGSEWTNAVEFLDETLKNIPQIVDEVEKASSFNVLVHGDMWCGNVMYKRDSSDKILSTKLIDFQQTALYVFVHDLCLFLHSSVKLEIRSRQTYEDLLRTYQHTLENEVKFYHPDTKVPSFDEVLAIMDRVKPYTFLLMCLAWPFQADDCHIVCSKGKGTGQPMFSSSMYESDQAKQILGSELRKLMNEIPFYDRDDL